MYQERKFENWRQGLLYLAIVIAMPILPIIIYMITENKCDSYLYVLLLTVIISFLFEFMSSPNSACSTFLKVENVICCVDLLVMLLWAFFRLLFTQSNGYSCNSLGIGDYILLSLFGVPIVITLIEIVRCIINDIKSSKFEPNEKNIVKGAALV